MYCKLEILQGQHNFVRNHPLKNTFPNRKIWLQNNVDVDVDVDVVVDVVVYGNAVVDVDVVVDVVVDGNC